MDAFENIITYQSLIKKVIHDRLKFYITPDHNSEKFANAVKTGLTSQRKFLLPQYFYDENGSKLFEQICELPEYYLTRLEASILASYADEIADICGKVMLVELGSGNAKKTRTIMGALLSKQEALHYFPVDISYEILKESSEVLLDEYKHLSISAITAEYDKGMNFIGRYDDRKLILFLGSSIGNFDPIEVKEFIHMNRSHMREGDMFLLGFDMHKDSRILNAAYNDVRGITAEFNLNILSRINRELDANFNLDKFEHNAFYDEAKRRIEMHLISKVAQEVNIGAIGETISFKEGESIHTENSYKFTYTQIESMIEGDFQIVKAWNDKKRWYSVVLLAPESTKVAVCF